MVIAREQVTGGTLQYIFGNRAFCTEKKRLNRCTAAGYELCLGLGNTIRLQLDLPHLLAKSDPCISPFPRGKYCLHIGNGREVAPFS